MRPATIGRLTAILALAAAPLSAQDPGTVELGLFGRMTTFDVSNPISRVPALGLGGRLGLFVLPNLEIEATGSYSDTHLNGTSVDVNYMPFRGLAVYNLPLGSEIIPIVGAGVGYSRYTGAITAKNTGPAGILGFKAYYGDAAMVRTEVTLDHFGTPFNWPQGVDRHLNWGWQIGVSVATGKPRRDSDGDGVRDIKDLCSMTPMGENVDAAGCPLDSDSDGVIDSVDRCPGTAAGVPVDRAGCARDTDGDGVPDNDDRCNRTPSGADVDARGCPIDSDGDRVPDAADRCAATPAGVQVDGNGCPRDRDGDGVADHRDGCANTPAGAMVDGRGCPMDRDEDGVPDGIDRCPNSEYGIDVDPRGCPVLFDEEEEAAVLVLEGVTFELGSAELTESAQEILNRVAESLEGNPEVTVEVSGHTDDSGTRALNLELSQERAEAVASYLADRGVTPDRLSAKGYGPDEPAASNETQAGRQINRRVELRRTN